MTKEDLITALEKEREDIRQQFDAKLSSIDMAILTLKQSFSMSTNGSASANGYNRGIPSKYKDYTTLNTRQKALSIFRNEGRFLHMREIVKIAQDLEPNEDAKDVARKISTAIYTIKNLDDSPLVNISIDNNNSLTFWGSKNWLDENGNVKAEHMYNETEITKKSSKSLEI
jgi:hypothetical protein